MSQFRWFIFKYPFQKQQFRLFLKETQTKQLTLDNLLDLPIRYLYETLNVFKEIKQFTIIESKSKTIELSHFDSITFDLCNILSNLEDKESTLLSNIDESKSYFYDYDDDYTSSTFFSSVTNTHFYDFSEKSTSSSETSITVFIDSNNSFIYYD